MEYDFSSLESKWQKKWEKKKIFQVKEGKDKKKKYYLLEMYPYPSGSGLHMGHALNYIIGDIFARFKRMNDFNVLHPMGYDSFGLPAENAAIKAKSHPKKFTEDAIKNFIRQQKALGLSYDWSRMVQSHDPAYYKWDQWIFLKMFEKGLAYRKKAPVNWCPKCNTVLANEQVHNGRCWRHEDTGVEVKYLEQWFFKITDYADELYKGINDLKGWAEDVKTMQRNWIGKSFGTEVYFEVEGERWPIFTTRPDTLFGVTFMVISVQHPRLMDLVTKEQKKEVEKFLKKIKSTSEKDLDLLKKEGVFTGSYATNPITAEKIPIWVGNFVVADYGAGMIMAVPAHDKRDFDFAKKYNLSIKAVIQPRGKKTNCEKEPYVSPGILINSGKFDGVENEKAKVEITKFLATQHKGKKTVQYKLKDWLISRQRFWGVPIPVIYCDKCGIVPVPEKDLPVKLPENIKFTSEKNPLVEYSKFVNVKCPKCGAKARRETDTMDTFVNSSWYFLRYCDAKNNKKIFDSKKANYWAPIDTYIGGKEHACMHLIYFRFYTKFLRDLKLLNFDEPTYRLFNQGMLHGPDGAVMAKSKGNVVLPEEVSKTYGIDTARLFLVSIASPDKDVTWNEKGINGTFKFIQKVLKYFGDLKFGESNARLESKLNKTIEGVTRDIESFRYNFAVIKIRNLFDSFPERISLEIAESFLKLLHPFCPHITEELWAKIGNKDFISLAKWPVADKKKINEAFEREDELVKSVIRDIINIKGILELENSKAYIYSIPTQTKLVEANKEFIGHVSGVKVISYAVNDKKKYDPEGKAKKAKLGKPAIYLE